MRRRLKEAHKRTSTSTTATATVNETHISNWDWSIIALNVLVFYLVIIYVCVYIHFWIYLYIKHFIEPCKRRILHIFNSDFIQINTQQSYMYTHKAIDTNLCANKTRARQWNWYWNFSRNRERTLRKEARVPREGESERENTRNRYWTLEK